jgi:hypothetical protein
MIVATPTLVSTGLHTSNIIAEVCDGDYKSFTRSGQAPDTTTCIKKSSLDVKRLQKDSSSRSALTKTAIYVFGGITYALAILIAGVER